MNALPVPAIELVEKYITHPSPARYVELARVSSAFDTVFSSDAAWQKLNIYQLKGSIARSYQLVHTELEIRSERFESCLYGQLDELCEAYEFSHLTFIENTRVWRVWAKIYRGRKPMLQMSFRVILESLSGPRRFLDWLDMAPQELQYDKEFVLDLALAGILNRIPEQFCDDDEVVAGVLKYYGSELPDASERLKQKRSMLLLAIDGGLSLGAIVDLGVDLDRELVLAAITFNGYDLRHARKFCGDREIVLAAVRQRASALEFAGDFKNDASMVLEAVRNVEILDRDPLYYASEALRDNKNIILEVLKRNGSSVASVSERLKNDKEVVIAAVSQCAQAISYVPERFRNDRDVLLAAAAQEISPVYKYAKKTLQSDRKFIMLLARSGKYWALETASPELRNDRDLVFVAVSNAGYQLKWASEQLKQDREVVLAAVKSCGSALKFASPGLRQDKELVLAAIAQDSEAIDEISDQLHYDEEVQVAIKRSLQVERKRREIEERIEAYQERLNTKAMEG